MKGIIIQGSSRSDGNTSTVVKYLRQISSFDCVDLKTKNIGYFDYEHNNAEDDFIPLMKGIVEEYDLIIFASPVYWYSMSAEMKTFFDRISDLLKTEKDTGRKLRGKSMAALSCSGHDDVPDSFFAPFELSADYLGMYYKGHAHTWVDSDTLSTQMEERINEFYKKLLA